SYPFGTHKSRASSRCSSPSPKPIRRTRRLRSSAGTWCAGAASCRIRSCSNRAWMRTAKSESAFTGPGPHPSARGTAWRADYAALVMEKAGRRARAPAASQDLLPPPPARFAAHELLQVPPAVLGDPPVQGRVVREHARVEAHLVRARGGVPGLPVNHELGEGVAVLHDGDDAVGVGFDEHSAVRLPRSARLVDHRVDRSV